MLNKTILIGRLCDDPSLRYTGSGTAVASFTLAVDRQRKSQSGEKEVDFINIVAWQKTAELVAQYLKKGRLAAVEGRLTIRQYDNREGQKVRVAEVIADSVQFLDKSDSTTSAPTANKAALDAQAPTRYNDDPFADDGGGEIDDDSLPF